MKNNKKISDISLPKPGNKISVQYLVGVFVVVIAIVGFGLIVNGEISGRATWSKVRPVKATSCDADEMCEVNHINGTLGYLYRLESRNIIVKGGDGIISDGIDVEHIGIRKSLGMTKESEASIPNLFVQNIFGVSNKVINFIGIINLTRSNNEFSGAIIKTDYFGNLFIRPSSIPHSDGMNTVQPTMTLEGRLNLSSILVSSTVSFETYSEGLAIISPSTRFSGKIVSDSLIGDGIAYACINKRGEIFRSTTPCV